MAIRMVKKLTRSHGRHSSSRNATCLVLGGTGLLGKALLERVKELNEEAGDLDGYGFVFASSTDADLSDNVLINTNVVQAAIEAKIPRAIFCLSTCAYPENVPQLPLVEEYLHLAPPHPSNEGYAAAKRLLEQQVRFGRERLQAENPGSGGMVTVRGTGQAYRQFLFSDDAARLLLLLLVKREIPENYCLLNMCPDLDDSGEPFLLRRFLST
ncbi:hypothetical protein Emag_003995 [Eimeria magna]